MATVEHSTTCRACGRDTEPFLSFGELPLANALVPIGTKDESRFPLMMTFCSNCGLVQLAESVDPDSLFRHYVYLSSNSPAFLDHVRILTERLIKERALDAGSLVIEIASNDGYLLRNYRKAGIPVLGVEPARNIAQVARKDGIDTISEFFSIDLAATLRSDGKLADVIHANNVLAHVPDLRGFVAGLASVLKPAGMVVIEVPYVRDMIEKLEFDTAYHEHLCYFSLTPLVALFAKSGLDIFRVERIPVHGGSLRIFARHAGGGASEFSVTQMLSDERQWRVRDPALYRRFADAVEKFRPTLRECLAALRADGKFTRSMDPKEAGFDRSKIDYFAAIKDQLPPLPTGNFKQDLVVFVDGKRSLGKVTFKSLKFSEGVIVQNGNEFKMASVAYVKFARSGTAIMRRKK